MCVHLHARGHVFSFQDKIHIHLPQSACVFFNKLFQDGLRGGGRAVCVSLSQNWKPSKEGDLRLYAFCNLLTYNQSEN